MKTNTHQQILKWNIFEEQMQMIKNLEYEFYEPKIFEKEFNEQKNKKKFNYY